MLKKIHIILLAIFWHWRKYWALPYAAILLIWCLVMSGEFFWGHVLVDCPHIILALSFIVVLVKQHFHAPFRLHLLPRHAL